MIYNVSELLERLNEIKNDGYNTVEISILDADEEIPECISFSVQNESEIINYDEVNSIDSEFD